MHRCLVLAEKGLGHVSPNPMVGCVIVYNGRIISEGYHKAYGGPHAEVNAINALDELSILRDCTVYVNLEPCAHHGKTPPCANLLAENKVGEVIIGTTDPNPLVAGKGIQILKAAGIPVTSGILENECLEANRRFFVNQLKKRPYVILKWAESADGFLGRQGERTSISGKESLAMTHKWRTEEDAYLIGTNTLLTDNPRLDSRLADGRNPIRIAIDFELKSENLPLEFKQGTQRTIILNGKLDALVDNVEYIKIPDRTIQSILNALWLKNIGSLVVEGGAQLLGSFLEHGIYDEVRIIKSKELKLSQGIKAPTFDGKAIEILEFEQDIYSRYK